MRTRNNQFSIRLTDTEQALWDKKQAQSGLSKTDFFIRMLKQSVIKIYSFDESVKDIIYELRKIGVNLNQAAYHLNSGFANEAACEIHNMTNQYSRTMESVQSFLDKPLINATIIKTEGGDAENVREC